MDILLVAPSILPVPSTKGGAIEKTLESILDFNEINGEHFYTVVSLYEQKAYEKSVKYNKSKIIYIKLNFFERLLQKIINRLSSKGAVKDLYAFKAKKKLLGKKFDACIIHNRPEYYKYFNQVTNKLALHLHNDKLNISTPNNREVLSQYDFVFTVSDYIKNKVIEIGSSANIETLYNGVDFKIFDGKKDVAKVDKLKRKLGIPLDNIVYIYSGRIVKEKGVIELVKAFNLACELNDRIFLIIAGGSKTEAGSDLNYQKRVQEEACKKIIFTGYVTYEELPKYESIANYGIVPSLFEEPFGKVVVEHLASNNRIIATNVGGIPEIVRSIEQGVLIDKNRDLINNLKEQVLIFADENKHTKTRESVEQFNIELFNINRLNLIDKFLK